MTETADVVIIGGGIIGTSVAYHLAEAGCSNVLIIEREERQGMGSSRKHGWRARAVYHRGQHSDVALFGGFLLEV